MSTWLKHSPLLVALVVCAALAAGCGGGGSSKNKAYSSSPAAYAAAVNQICASTNAKMKALQPTSLADLVKNGDKIKSTLNDTLDQIEKIQPPAQLKSTAADLVAKEREALGKFDSLIAAAKAQDSAKLQQVESEIVPITAAVKQDAAKLGVSHCGAQTAG